jgi:hypothetical protein
LAFIEVAVKNNGIDGGVELFDEALPPGPEKQLHWIEGTRGRRSVLRQSGRSPSSVLRYWLAA